MATGVIFVDDTNAVTARTYSTGLTQVAAGAGNVLDPSQSAYDKGLVLAGVGYVRVSLADTPSDVDTITAIKITVKSKTISIINDSMTLVVSLWDAVGMRLTDDATNRSAVAAQLADGTAESTLTISAGTLTKAQMDGANLELRTTQAISMGADSGAAFLVDSVQIDITYTTPPYGGHGSFSWNVAGSAAGKRDPVGSSAVEHDWSVTAQGVKPTAGVTQGSGLVSHFWTDSAAGKRTPKATGATGVSWASSAVGRRTAKSSVTTSWVMNTAATGFRWTNGRVTTSWTAATSAIGKRAPKTNVTVYIAWATSALGARPRRGDAATTWRMVLAATGRTTRKGTATASHTWKGYASGGSTGVILNNADSIFLGSRAVDAVYVGDEQVWPTP